MPSDPKLWITILVLFLLFVWGLYFLIYTPDRRRAKRRRKPEKPQEQKDWKQISLRLEKHIQDLRKENVEFQKRIRVLEKQEEVYKGRYAEIQDRLQREKIWQKKEEEDLTKKNRQMKQYQEEVRQLEQRMEQEHAELIILRRSEAELKDTVERLEHQIKYLQGESQKAQAQADGYRKEMMELRSQNARLSKKHEDTQWIAKSVHLKLKEELRQVKNDLERLQSGEGSA